jgi:hypothetical protein
MVRGDRARGWDSVGMLLHCTNHDLNSGYVDLSARVPRCIQADSALLNPWLVTTSVCVLCSTDTASQGISWLLAYVYPMPYLP